ncbi:MAG: SDR family NAD(P)-dependent oxidoreductase [Bacteroidales bacterium]|jgi:NADP-dependent 3-hydroxy acid dehydrogenase YdfG|nr:SDR family NAD(P)-dependent oxidoreductase [Bacteroidales bacterium]
MSDIVMVTGSTSGIGKAIAELLAKNGFRVIVTGRRKERIEELVDELKLKHNCSITGLSFDITNKDEVYDAIDSLPEEWRNIDILINNAGLASGLDPIYEGDLNDWEIMIDTNIKGLLYISRKITKGMIERQKGQIINIGSIAGREVYPSGNVYNATKHAVDAITKAMRIDLLKYKIRVSQVAPGLVKTEFSEVRFHGDTERAEQVYQGYEPLQAIDIAEAVHFVITRPEHVNINDMLIMPTAQANSYNIDKKIEELW